MKLEVGEYIRTNLGIAKIISSEKNHLGNEFLLDKEIIDTHEDYYTNCMYDYKFYLEQIIKASHNIIDLIEVGDYVNGGEVVFIDDDFTKEIAIREVDLTTRDFEGRYDFKRIKKEEIKSIVTREQFEAMQYKVV